MPGGRRIRLSGEAGQHRAAAIRAADVAPSLGRGADMTEQEKVNILLVDDQPAKLLSYEVILRDLGENLIKASSGREGLEHLLRSEIAVILVDVCMPDLDGFQLAAMIREHPRFQKTAMIFISATWIACAAMRWARSITCRSPLCPRCCAPKSRSSPSSIARPGSSSVSIRSSRSASPRARRSSRHPTPV